MKQIKKITYYRMLALVMACSAAAYGHAQAQPLRSAVDATFAPHAMTKLGGGVQGFNVDLGEEIAKRVGKEIVIEGAEFSGLVPGLNSGRYDFLVAPVTVTPERAKSLLFTEGYFDTDYTFLGKKDAPKVESLEQLKGKTLAVNKGSNYEGWARDNAQQYGFKYDVYGSNADAVQAVQSGRADYNLAGTTVVAWVAKQNPNLQTSYTIKTGLVWALAFRKDDVEGRAKVSNILKCMKLDGTVAALAEKWFGIVPEAGNSAITVVEGTGVPETEGYDPTPVKPVCS
ncbi:transporter substrate-binding domain-containing protein [Alcaligenes endophyticus]|uniref:Transporter substrate-binding domain-containing protein n=1 Tax=Alcaligenes endophyticus TaxID=1929088 RepID=A0ABT8EN35_9BURK|nr:transporter substrate-binding domain-containing protein [Alcaligenes endophyticus]MCX5591408.1 transporter substrate-binding domain-containing protein [Alcaligenes endophyticus]MDN4122711.1 transporter substrate-binding domain-containing protein [Alcaligenes endophyticus]